MTTNPRSMRHQIAVSAAKRVAEGEPDYWRALALARTQLGATRGDENPTFDEVDAEVAAYCTLFAPGSSDDVLWSLRQSAHSLMKSLQEYAPRLYGPVATGTANKFSTAWLELALEPTDDKEFEIGLLNRGWPFEFVGAPGALRPASSSAYSIAWQGHEVVVRLAGKRWRLTDRSWTRRVSLLELTELLATRQQVESRV